MNRHAIKSLISGLVLLALLTGSAVVYLDYSFATSRSDAAKLHIQTYDIGTSYSGTIIKQFVAPGDTVRAGQTIATFKSDELTSQLAAGTISRTSLTYGLDETGALVITASRAGRVATMYYLEGSFVPANQRIASLTDNASVQITADFKLPAGAQRIMTVDTPLEVTLPSGKRAQAKITQLSVATKQGHRIISVQAELGQDRDNQFTLNGDTPVDAKLILKDTTLFSQLNQLTAEVITHWVK